MPIRPCCGSRMAAAAGAGQWGSGAVGHQRSAKQQEQSNCCMKAVGHPMPPQQANAILLCNCCTHPPGMLVTAWGQSPYGRSRCAMRQLCGQDTHVGRIRTAQHQWTSNAQIGGEQGWACPQKHIAPLLRTGHPPWVNTPSMLTTAQAKHRSHTHACFLLLRPTPIPPKPAHLCENLQHVEVSICVKLVPHIVARNGGRDARLQQERQQEGQHD